MKNLPVMLSLVIPCYNEENTLAACIKRVLALKSYEICLEIIIVDDCSSDDSYRVACELAKKHSEIQVLRHPQNQGKGAALRSGIVYAHGAYVGIQDADMEYEPLDYLNLLEPLCDGRAEVVYGSRYLRPDTRKVLYFWHTWMNKTLTTVSNMFTNLDITDMETCYKLFKREVIQEIAPTLKEERFGFEPEVTAKVAQGKYRVYECAISYNPRTFEEGKKINWKDGVRALYCILHYGAYTAPLPMQLLMYFFIGLISALINIALFCVFINLEFTILLSIVLAFLLAAGVNYLLCIALLFRHKARWSTQGELIAYMITIVIMGMLDYGMTNVLLTVGFSSVWSKTWAALFGFIGNFILRKYIVFPENEPVLEPFLRKLRLQKVFNIIKKHDNPSVLDIGCGKDAKLLIEIAPHISSGVGIDFKAPQLKGYSNIITTMYLGKKLPFADASFDIVTMLAVLEHLEYPDEMIKEIRRVLKPNGCLVGTVPSKAAKPVLEFLAYKVGIVSESEIRDHKCYYSKKN